MAFSKAHKYADALVGISSVAKAISHPARTKILFDLQFGERKAGDLAIGHQISPQSVSRHCQILLKSELIHAQVKGKHVFYNYNPKLIPKLVKNAINEILDEKTTYFIPPPIKNLEH